VTKPSVLAAAISPPLSQGEARVRLAVVQANPAPTADTVYVMIQGGTEVFALPYPAGYVPLPGDVVEVLSIAAGATETAVVVMALSGRAGNRVLNGDFLVVNPAVGGPPPNWYHHRAAGSAGSTVTGSLFSPHETPLMIMSVSSAGATDNYAYSAPIPVAPGDSYRLDAVGRIDAVDPGCTVELLATWYAAAEHLYPNTVAADSLADSAIAGAPVDFGIGLNSITVPAGARWMRVAVRVIGDAGGTGVTVHMFSVQAYRNP
jgi:hypothetical protein